MNVAIDLSAVDLSTPNGTKYYSLNLLKYLSHYDTTSYYYVITYDTLNIRLSENFHVVCLKHRCIFLDHEFQTWHYVRKFNIDIIHYPTPFGTLLKFANRSIYTIHDTRFLNFSKKGNLSKQLLKNMIKWLKFKRALHYADIFITDTTAIKTELIRKYQPRQIIKVIPPGISGVFTRSLPTKPKNYILAYSDKYGRKNISTTLRVFALVNNKLHRQYNLYVVTPDKDTASSVIKLAKKLKIFSFIRVFTAASLTKMRQLYQSATCLLFPSTYEGLGLPLIEAMACGCPIVASGTETLKEVAGQAALFVNPLNEDSVATGLHQVLTSPSLRKKLIRQGFKQFRRYDSGKFVRNILRLYKNIYKNKE